MPAEAYFSTKEAPLTLMKHPRAAMSGAMRGPAPPRFGVWNVSFSTFTEMRACSRGLELHCYGTGDSSLFSQSFVRLSAKTLRIEKIVFLVAGQHEQLSSTRVQRHMGYRFRELKLFEFSPVQQVEYRKLPGEIFHHRDLPGRAQCHIAPEEPPG